MEIIKFTMLMIIIMVVMIMIIIIMIIIVIIIIKITVTMIILIRVINSPHKINPFGSSSKTLQASLPALFHFHLL